MILSIFDRYISMKYESKIISFSCIVSMIAAVIIIPSANAYTPYPTLTTKVLHSSEYYQMIGTDWSHDTYYMHLNYLNGKDDENAPEPASETQESDNTEYERKGKDVGISAYYEYPDNPLQKIENTTDNPYRKIVRIENDEGNCTGTIIADRVILTAGHCLARIKMNENTDGTQSVISRSMHEVDEIAPAKSCYGYSQLYDPDSYMWFVNETYWNTGNRLYDWGVIILANDNYSKQVGYYGFGAYNINVGDKIRITGYPKNENYDGYHMYTSTGKITQLKFGILPKNQKYAGYDASMVGGDSGAGIEANESLHKGMLIGVNGQDSCNGNLCTSAGLIIDKYKFNYLNQIADKDSALIQ